MKMQTETLGNKLVSTHSAVFLDLRVCFYVCINVSWHTTKHYFTTGGDDGGCEL
jgi:hypothetical protein